MKSLLLTITFVSLAVISQTVEATRVDSCYTCEPTTSWKECKDNQVKTSCDCSHLAANCDRCLKYQGSKNGIQTFGKMCATKNFCDGGYVSCQSLMNTRDRDCEIFCCDEDDCNSATSTMVSMMVMTLMALAAIIKNFY